MLLGPIGKSILSGDNGVPTNRLPYNSRQRKPSIDSDSSSTGDNSDGPSSDEYKFVETSHPQEVNQFPLTDSYSICSFVFILYVFCRYLLV